MHDGAQVSVQRVRHYGDVCAATAAAQSTHGLIAFSTTITPSLSNCHRSRSVNGGADAMANVNLVATFAPATTM